LRTSKVRVVHPEKRLTALIDRVPITESDWLAKRFQEYRSRLMELPRPLLRHDRLRG
jgi:hypothetical protein